MNAAAVASAAVVSAIVAALLGMGLTAIEPSEPERSRYWLAYAALAVILAGLGAGTYFGTSKEAIGPQGASSETLAGNYSPREHIKINAISLN